MNCLESIFYDVSKPFKIKHTHSLSLSLPFPAHILFYRRTLKMFTNDNEKMVDVFLKISSRMSRLSSAGGIYIRFSRSFTAKGVSSKDPTGV